MYSVFVQLGDGEFLPVASRDELEQAVQLVEAFAGGGVLSRNDPHPGHQISSFSECACVTHRSDQDRLTKSIPTTCSFMGCLLPRSLQLQRPAADHPIRWEPVSNKFSKAV